jgi:hypothetical protein
MAQGLPMHSCQSGAGGVVLFFLPFPALHAIVPEKMHVLHSCPVQIILPASLSTDHRAFLRADGLRGVHSEVLATLDAV